jgi:phage terminase small subunit
MALTPKQQCFVAEYLVDLNATQAAIRAGYSARRAAEIGYQLLHKTTVSEAIQAAQLDRSTRTGLTQDKVLADIEQVRELAIQDGQYTAALKASEMQARHLGMFTDRLQVTTSHEDALKELE